MYPQNAAQTHTDTQAHACTMHTQHISNVWHIDERLWMYIYFNSNTDLYFCRTCEIAWPKGCTKIKTLKKTYLIVCNSFWLMSQQIYDKLSQTQKTFKKVYIS